MRYRNKEKKICLCRVERISVSDRTLDFSINVYRTWYDNIHCANWKYCVYKVFAACYTRWTAETVTETHYCCPLKQHKCIQNGLVVKLWTFMISASFSTLAPGCTHRYCMQALVLHIWINIPAVHVGDSSLQMTQQQSAEPSEENWGQIGLSTGLNLPIIPETRLLLHCAALLLKPTANCSFQRLMNTQIYNRTHAES